jgi:HD-GYP domain-containing protein (c-di-GMP phosphodiesterase class II)
MLLSVKPDQVVSGMLLAQDVLMEDREVVLKREHCLSENEISYLRENYNGNEVLIIEPRLYNSHKNLTLSDQDIQYGIECALLGELDITHTYKLLNVVYAHVGSLFTKIYPQLLDLRKLDPVTFNHCVNVTWYSLYLGRFRRLNQIEMDFLLQAALLHDIGKSFIPRSLLSKPGKLTNDEFEVITRHSEYGSSWLAQFVHSDVSEYIRSHHEYLDGSGYPDKKDKASINFSAHIITVADIFDAVMQKRVYKNSLSPFQAYKILLNEVQLGKISFIYVVLLWHVLDYLKGRNVLIGNSVVGTFERVISLSHASVVVNGLVTKIRMECINSIV